MNVETAPMTVVGIGNLLMGDDGVGVHVINELEKIGPLPGVALRDLGTSSMDLLDVFLASRRVIVVDAVAGGQEAGTVYRLTPDALHSDSRVRLSAHDSQLGDVIAAARSLGSTAEVVIFGIEPKTVEAAPGLSESVSEAAERVVRLIVSEVLL